MTANHDSESGTDLPIDEIDRLEDVDVEEPLETAASMATDAGKAGLLPLASGGLLLISAVRSVVRGKLRAIPVGLAGFALVRYGLRKRRSSADEASTFEPSTEGIDGGTEGKEVSDGAATATGHPENVDIDETGDIPDEAELSEDDGGSRIEFVEDEPGDRELPHDEPELEESDEDPRRDETGSDDDTTEIDLSQSSMAEEASEAAGPSPGQAQPTQTDATEPEETPEEDASDMKVEPDEDDDDVEAAEADDDVDADGTDEEDDAEDEAT
ncbi:hypothetical protein [Halopiger goleimassiliensis]|uniref:hypothetical protein n=1 Tax=Halopiger goleimassiliensis TaxID=1293048 RepID=UPI00067798AD|nr:hypothetical protein [Halopiger goleimassiliensis]